MLPGVDEHFSVSHAWLDIILIAQDHTSTRVGDFFFGLVRKDLYGYWTDGGKVPQKKEVLGRNTHTCVCVFHY